MSNKQQPPNGQAKPSESKIIMQAVKTSEQKAITKPNKNVNVPKHELMNYSGGGEDK